MAYIIFYIFDTLYNTWTNQLFHNINISYDLKEHLILIVSTYSEFLWLWTFEKVIIIQ